MTRTGFARCEAGPARPRGVGAAVGALSGALAVFVFAGCSSPPPPLELDPDSETEEGLQAVVRPRVQEAWIRPDVDFASYHGLWIEPIRIEDRPGGSTARYPRTATGHYELTAADRVALARELAAAFANEVEKDARLQRVMAPGPGVLSLRASLVDVTKRVPESQSYPGSTAVFANTAGQLTLELEVRDGASDELLARVVDRRDVRSPGVGATGLGHTNVVVQTADLRRVFNRWARLMNERLTQLQGPLDAAAAETGVDPQAVGE